MLEGIVEKQLKEIISGNKKIENLLKNNDAAIICSDGEIHVVENISYGRLDIPWHGGKIKQVNITQNIRMN